MGLMRRPLLSARLLFTLFVLFKLSHGHLHRRLQPRQYELWSSEQIHSTLLEWRNEYPALVRATTGQERYGLPTAGEPDDCPFDEGDGCLNYFFTIQDFVVHPEGSDSANRLPEVFWSGELHGDERVGPTAVMEAAALLLEAAQCESAFYSDPGLHQSCSDALLEKGVDKRYRQWLARLVSTRRIVVAPNINSLGYYKNERTESGVDVNRDFPFDYEDPTMCMRTIAARTLNEIFREHMFQLALSFHAGFELVGYEWGADSFAGSLSPDDESQNQIAIAYSAYGGSWNLSGFYPIGPIDQLLYTVKGSMEDWAYAGSWIPEKVVACEPTSYGGYPTEKVIYNDSMLRAFNILVETSTRKLPGSSMLGTEEDVLNNTTVGNGHVSRNIRLSILSAELVEPYISFHGVNEMAPPTDVLPLTTVPCGRMNAVHVPANLSAVTVEWTVGGAFEIEETQLFFGKWDDIADADVTCRSQPPRNISSYLTSGHRLDQGSGTGYFSQFGVYPPAISNTGKQPLGPVFKGAVGLSRFQVGDEVVVFVRARVDQSWVQQPEGIAPQVPPQSHIVNARTNLLWYHENNEKVIEGRLDWFSVVPLTLIITNTTEVSPAVGMPTTETSASFVYSLWFPGLAVFSLICTFL